jgi:uncharacterized protein (DUF342 family)
MFIKSRIEAKLDEEIISLLSKLDETPDKNSEEYASLVERVSKLHKLKVEERPKPMSKDTALAVAANIFGILWIAGFERENVITSKALSFVLRPRA